LNYKNTEDKSPGSDKVSLRGGPDEEIPIIVVDSNGLPIFRGFLTSFFMLRMKNLRSE